MIAWLERNQFLALGLAGLLLICGLVVKDLAADDRPPALIIQEGGAEAGAMIRVQVSGAVAQPGIYEMTGGDRVEDAIAAAGGPSVGAALDDLNLARHLRDGERIDVPGGSGTEAASAPPPVSAGGLVDVNTANQSQLMALPGIGEAYSRRIIDSREVDGPYASVDELVARKVLPAATLAKIRGQLTVSVP
jgi:competence protein ComEA